MAELKDSLLEFIKEQKQHIQRYRTINIEGRPDQYYEGILIGLADIKTFISIWEQRKAIWNKESS